MAHVATSLFSPALTSPDAESLSIQVHSSNLTTRVVPNAPVGMLNQTPGILDRRKSGRPRNKGRKVQRIGEDWRDSDPPPIHLTMADDDEQVKTPESEDGPTSDETSDSFEDAPDTPKAQAPPSNKATEVAEDKEQDHQGAVLGLGFDSVVAKEHPPHAPAEDVEETPKDGSGEELNKTSRPLSFLADPTTSDELDVTHPAPVKPRPLSQRFMSPPLTHSRQRSLSPGRFPVRTAESTHSRSSSITPGSSGRRSPEQGLSPSATPATEILSSSSSQQLSTDPSPPQSGGFARKASTGFGAFLGRMGTIRRGAKSPTGRMVERTNTASTTASQETGSSTALAAVLDGAEGDGDKPRPSLQDRFRTLREQEEEHHGDGTDGTIGSVDTSKGPAVPQKDGEPNTTTATEHSEDLGQVRRHRASSSVVLTSPLNSSLPPGTASGMSAGPADEPTRVDWDLWQAVVYEGPTAVARTSGEELSRAIAHGIPAAIRGVVWQVLADSKSEELEALYKTLKTRGNENELRPPPMPRTDSEVSQATPGESTSGRSSRSSTHSASSSGLATSSVTTPAISEESNAGELQNKLLAEKQKRESAAIQKLEKAIKRDLGSRTSYSKYTQSAGLQDGLFGVCKAYALFDTTISYAQGINFIAMPLLFNMSEEEAFTLLVRMMHQYQLRTLFEPEMPGLHLRLYQFERLLEDTEPTLFCHLKRRNVSPQLYATPWFLTLFAYRFPLQLVLRVYDLFFSEGLTAILKFGIVLMQRNKAALLEMKDMSHLTNFLKEKVFDVYIDKSPSASSLLDSGFFGSVTGGADKELYRADEMVHDASEVRVTEEMLQAYQVEWDENRRVEREREAELEELRTTNITLTAKVKALEERSQQHDTEHVNIASDLVKYKVENDALQDAKEGLQIQVQELQKMVDALPAEVEARLKVEMERIMQRNLEVQNENRHLQDELADAEHQLVTTSLTHAQTQSDLDSLKQKWSNLQAMLNKQ